jgi:hypothetical protein
MGLGLPKGEFWEEKSLLNTQFWERIGRAISIL